MRCMPGFKPCLLRVFPSLPGFSPQLDSDTQSDVIASLKAKLNDIPDGVEKVAGALELVDKIVEFWSGFVAVVDGAELGTMTEAQVKGCERLLDTMSQRLEIAQANDITAIVNHAVTRILRED